MARQRIHWRKVEGRDEGGAGRIESVHRFKTRPPLFSSRILPTIVPGREDCTVSICPTGVPRESSSLLFLDSLKFS